MAINSFDPIYTDEEETNINLEQIQKIVAQIQAQIKSIEDRLKTLEAR